jgi:nicotinate-nucleotide adenylyltransferase
MKTGLFFGTFNPIHHGHLMVANYMHQFTDLDEIWFVITPQSPFKKRENLLDNRDRQHLVNLAIKDQYDFKASDIEFDLPKPNYTVHTLTYLREKYPKREFVLIMGGDNLTHLHKWYNVEQILDNHKIYVYRRPGSDISDRWESSIGKGVIQVFDAPQLDISASFIRKAIQNQKNIRYFIPDAVYQYIKEMHFYEN